MKAGKAQYLSSPKLSQQFFLPLTIMPHAQLRIQQSLFRRIEFVIDHTMHPTKQRMYSNTFKILSLINDKG